MAGSFTGSRMPIIQPKSGRFNHTQTGLLFHYIFNTIPTVNKLLHYWEWEASLCPDMELRKQALASIQSKSFHCHGGSFFAAPFGKYGNALVELIVAYQTLCDYLDNLCDRANVKDEAAFFQLHTALYDALNLESPKHNYYEKYPYKDDGGYIDKLVDDCQRCLEYLPSYSLVSGDINRLIYLYTCLQAYKHIDLEFREKVLKTWAESYLPSFPDLLWQEFAAASGSTLGIFIMFGLAAAGAGAKPDVCRALIESYFPWISGLHILLDYLIDQTEDRRGGDLNFTFYYPDQAFTLQRLQMFIYKSLEQIQNVPYSAFNRTVIEGLLAMYLSDPKVREQGMEEMAVQLVNTAGGKCAFVMRLCRMVRKYYL